RFHQRLFRICRCEWAPKHWHAGAATYSCRRVSPALRFAQLLKVWSVPHVSTPKPVSPRHRQLGTQALRLVEMSSFTALMGRAQCAVTTLSEPKYQFEPAQADRPTKF